MIVGHNHQALERRISTVLLSGTAYPREAQFLQKLSMQILRHGQNARLSDRQGAWLLAILRRCEADTGSKPPLAPRRRQQTKPKAKSEDSVLMRASIEPLELMRHSDQHFETVEACEHGNDNAAPATSSTPPAMMIEATTPTEGPAAMAQTDFGSILARIVQKNHLLRQRRERIGRSPRPSAHIPNKA
ncbi:hypothetical protein IVB36_22570 [Bradyrhizobium sp. 35]|uniref:hypothetical protein n=1 Tax=Bradyrhizobium sp. 35 TaxID=2782670 RepID=UPI001FFAB0CE|nr:hypothetical protein [Bradyrhizobium sp. 35]MCK1453580.1 hypothetical protein [Bradyrhizobium sp. 35]